MFQYQLPIRTHIETHKPSTYCNEVNSTKTNMKELKWNAGIHDQSTWSILRQKQHTLNIQYTFYILGSPTSTPLSIQKYYETELSHCLSSLALSLSLSHRHTVDREMLGSKILCYILKAGCFLLCFECHCRSCWASVWLAARRFRFYNHHHKKHWKGS